jgi:hypothetical protein
VRKRRKQEKEKRGRSKLDKMKESRRNKEKIGEASESKYGCTGTEDGLVPNGE